MKSFLKYLALSAVLLYLTGVFLMRLFKFAHYGAGYGQLSGIFIGGLLCSCLSVWSMRRMFRRYYIYRIERARKMQK